MRLILATKRWKIANCNPFPVWVERLRDVTRGTLHLVVLQRSRVLATMVKRCVAAGCSNTYNENVSMFHFPKESVLRREWVKQVQRTRAQWPGPSEHSVLCSDHFDVSCFEQDSELASQMGIQKRIRLKADAIPTVFERPSVSSAPSLHSQASVASPSNRLSRKRTSSSASHADVISLKTKRKAFENRERSRVSKSF